MKPQFKKEWTPTDFKTVESAIAKHFKGDYDTHHGPAHLNGIKSIEKVLGLAYTSSSSYAMYNICNT
jgi:hypothetical protein